MHDKIYLDLMKKVMEQGKLRDDRTKVGTYSLFGEQVRYDLREGFPLLTTKKVHWKSVVGELLWFLEGNTNNNDLVNKYGVSIWNEWAKKDGDLGPVYGKQWRAWVINKDNGYQYEKDNDWYGIYTEETFDQIQNVINQIKNTPNDRGIIISAWNVADLSAMALRPCHTMFQFYVDGDELDLQLYQRSADIFLGVPFNIASYALLLSMIAQVTGKKPRFMIHTLGDAHLYINHVEQAKLQLSREPFESPKLSLDLSVEDIDDFKLEHITLLDYVSHPGIKAPVAV